MGGGDFDLLDLTAGPSPPINNEPILGMEQQANTQTLGANGNITYNSGAIANNNQNQQSNLEGFSQGEFDLVNLNNLGNQ